jgi:hypothetical protein
VNPSTNDKDSNAVNASGDTFIVKDVFLCEDVSIGDVHDGRCCGFLVALAELNLQYLYFRTCLAAARKKCAVAGRCVRPSLRDLLQHSERVIAHQLLP